MLSIRQEQRERNEAMNSERPDGLRKSHCWSSTVDAIQASPTRKSSGQHRPRAPTRTYCAVLSAALNSPTSFFSSLFFFFSSHNRKFFFPPRQKFDSSGILLHACGVVLAGENNLFFPTPRAAAKKPSCSCSFVCGIQIPCLYSFLYLLFLFYDSFLSIQK